MIVYLVIPFFLKKKKIKDFKSLGKEIIPTLIKLQQAKVIDKDNYILQKAKEN